MKLYFAPRTHSIRPRWLLEGRPRLVEYVYLHCQRPAIQRAVL
jgi:hypothetical protein